MTKTEKSKWLFISANIWLILFFIEGWVSSVIDYLDNTTPDYNNFAYILYFALIFIPYIFMMNKAYKD